MQDLFASIIPPDAANNNNNGNNGGRGGGRGGFANMANLDEATRAKFDEQMSELPGEELHREHGGHRQIS